MRAIIIDPQTQSVSEVEHSGDYKEIYKFIGNDCGTFSAPIELDNGDTFYCDDEGLFHENIGGIIYPNWAYPITGRILILNTDYDTGDSQSAKSNIDSIKEGLKFLKPDDSTLVNWFAQFQ